MGLLVAIVIGFFVFFSVTGARNAQLNSVYRRLAARYQGQFHRGGLVSLPYLRFVYHGAHVLLDTYYGSFPIRWSSYTQFHISWPDHHLSMRLRPALWHEKLRRSVGGTRHIRLNNQHYNDRFHVTGSDSDAIQSMLTGGVLSVIDQLQILGSRNDASLEIHDGILIIRKRGVLRDYALARKFTILGLELFDQAMISRMHGIDIVEENYEVTYHSEAVCKICGERIEQDIVYCQTCRTPHHLECWDYYGLCSVYGCGETRCTRQAKVSNG